MTPQGLDLLKRFEGKRLTAYKDSAGVWTIGYGHTGPEVHEGQTITELEALNLLLQDVKTAQDAVSALVDVPLSDAQKDALTSFVFNVGVGAFKKSTLLRKLNASDYRGAANEFQRWNKAGGQILTGLVNRRAAERDLFLTDVTQEASMPFPFIAAALPAILSAVPDLLKLTVFSDRTQASSKAYQAAAEKVIDVAIQATGAANAQEAAEKVTSDPSMAEAVREAVKGQWFELVEAGGGGIAAAREYNLKSSEVPFWKQPAFIVSVLLLPLVYYVAAMVLQFGDFSQETKAMVVAAIITGVLGGITGFFLGSSVSSRAKDDILAKR